MGHIELEGNTRVGREEKDSRDIIPAIHVASFRVLIKFASRLLVLALLTVIFARVVQTAPSVASCIRTAVHIVGPVLEVQSLCLAQGSGESRCLGLCS
jgi:hypothetical protein